MQKLLLKLNNLPITIEVNEDIKIANNPNKGGLAAGLLFFPKPHKYVNIEFFRKNTRTGNK